MLVEVSVQAVSQAYTSRPCLLRTSKRMFVLRALHELFKGLLQIPQHLSLSACGSQKSLPVRLLELLVAKLLQSGAAQSDARLLRVTHPLGSSNTFRFFTASWRTLAPNLRASDCVRHYPPDMSCWASVSGRSPYLAGCRVRAAPCAASHAD